MNSKERMLLALNREKPDRLPVTIHHWQKYHLEHYMKGMTEIQAFEAAGLDASVNYSRFADVLSTDWRVEIKNRKWDDCLVRDYTISTPKGKLSTSEGQNSITTWVIEHLIKKPEDIYLLKYMPVPQLDKDGFTSIYDELGDKGILRSLLPGKQGGCWQDACELFGVENLIYATFDDPDWVHKFLGILLEQKLTYIENNLSNLLFDIIETGGGASSNTIISPAIHKEFCLPYDTKIHDALHNVGQKAVYHTCGGMMKILDLIVQNHCDVSETLSPVAMGGDIRSGEDAEYVRKKLLPHVGMIGGMDQANILGSGNRSNIEKEVKRLFKVFGRDGGYICSASDNFFHVPYSDLVAFAEAGKACLY